MQKVKQYKLLNGTMKSLTLIFILSFIVIGCTMITVIDEPIMERVVQEDTISVVSDTTTKSDTTRLYPIEFGVEINGWEDTDTTEVVI